MTKKSLLVSPRDDNDLNQKIALTNTMIQPMLYGFMPCLDPLIPALCVQQYKPDTTIQILWLNK